MAYTPRNVNGQATMANSEPVVIASDQSAVAVLDTNSAAIKTAVQLIDDFISGSRGLVTEDNSAAIKTAVETIDNFISGARGLVTEDNSASIKTAVEKIDDFISGARGLVTEDNSGSIKTSVELIDDAVYTDGSGTVTKGLAILGQDGTNPQAIKTDAAGELQIDVLTLPALVASSANIGDVDVLTINGVAPAFGTGARGATVQRVTIATDDAVPITDNAGSLTVDQPTGTNLHTVIDSGTITTVTSVTNAVTVSQGTATNLKTQAEAYMGGAAVSATNPLAIRAQRPATYLYNIASTVHVASANTVMWDLFNADAALIVRVISIRQIPNVTTAVVGIVFDWLLERTTSVGTGGTGQTAWLPDTSDTALDADITCRLKPTGGAAQSTDLVNYSISSEETTPATIQLASQGGLEIVPDPCLQYNGGKGIVLRQNQGIRCVQITNSNAGNTGWLIAFTVE